MDVHPDLRLVAERIADVGPSVALDETTLVALEQTASDYSVVGAVANRVGAEDGARIWLGDLVRRAHEAVQQPDADHALLVSGLAALGLLIADERPEHATVAFEAVSLR